MKEVLRYMIRKSLANHRLLSQMISLLGAFLLVLSLWLPFVSATDVYKEYLTKYPDIMYYEPLNMKNQEAVHISLIEFAKIYYTSFENEQSREISITCFVIICVLSSFMILILLFCLLKKPILIGLFNSLTLCIFQLLKFDFEDRGVIPTKQYDWGMAQYVFYFGVILIFTGAIWIFLIKRNDKKGELKNV